MEMGKLTITIEKEDLETKSLDYECLGLDEWLNLHFEIIDAQGEKVTVSNIRTDPFEIINSIKSLTKSGLVELDLTVGIFPQPKIMLRLLNEGLMDIILFPQQIILGEFYNTHNELDSEKIKNLLNELIEIINEETKNKDMISYVNVKPKKDESKEYFKYQKTNKIKDEINTYFSDKKLKPVYVGGNILFEPSPIAVRVSPYDYLSMVILLAESCFSLVEHDDIENSRIYKNFQNDVEEFKKFLESIKIQREEALAKHRAGRERPA